MTFSELGLLPELIEAIEEKGYSKPTSIQEQAIPFVLAGYDLLAGSQTGTGKTASFTLPMLQNLMKKKGGFPIKTRGLILTPTRELACQVEKSVKELSKNLPLKSMAVYGGVSIKMQVLKLRKGVDIIVATPGRLLDLFEQKIVNLAHIEMLVLDEADRMLDMGFMPDIMRILSLLPPTRQSLLFSATFSKEIKKLSASFLNQPRIIETSQSNSAVDLISQVVHPVDAKRKSELLSNLITDNDWQQALVFMRTKHSADKLANQLKNEGITAASIHGDKSQGARTRVLEDFKRGKVRILVATDVAARGLDINQLPYVVNYDLPTCPEDYVHRIGRTGRAGNTGQAISLVAYEESRLLKGIEKLLKKDIEKVLIPNFEPSQQNKVVSEKAFFEPNQNRAVRNTAPRNNRRKSESNQPYPRKESASYPKKKSAPFYSRKESASYPKKESAPFYSRKESTSYPKKESTPFYSRKESTQPYAKSFKENDIQTTKDNDKKPNLSGKLPSNKKKFGQKFNSFKTNKFGQNSAKFGQKPAKKKNFSKP